MKLNFLLVTYALLLLLYGAAASAQDAAGPAFPTSEPLAVITGFSGPESVRYDPQLDVYYVSNFNGEASGDANGFVSRVSADGEILDLHFMTGTSAAPFHGGRGMYLDGDSLLVADADGIHRFDRGSGEPLAFIDFSAFEPGFLNDIVVDDDGSIFVTDTGTSRLFRIDDGEVTVATETPFAANGITIDPASGELILVPWEGSDEIVAWNPQTGDFRTLGAVAGGGNYDGVEVIMGAIVSASQADTSLHVMHNGSDRQALMLAGRPADIGIDRKRRRIAVPYVSLDRVDLFAYGENRD